MIRAKLAITQRHVRSGSADYGEGDKDRAKRDNESGQVSQVGLIEVMRKAMTWLANR
jgi:hypothetical protein